MNKFLVFLMILTSPLFSQVETKSDIAVDTITYVSQLVNDSFPDWVKLWRRQNPDFDTRQFKMYYYDQDWKMDITESPKSLKYMSKRDSSLVKISPNGKKYIQLCGFCSYTTDKNGNETMDGDYHGYVVYADLKNWKAQSILFWSLMAPLIEGKWIDDDRFLIIGEELIDSMVMPSYYLVDTKRKTNIRFDSKIFCAPLSGHKKN